MSSVTCVIWHISVIYDIWHIWHMKYDEFDMRSYGCLKNPQDRSNLSPNLCFAYNLFSLKSWISQKICLSFMIVKNPLHNESGHCYVHGYSSFTFPMYVSPKHPWEVELIPTYFLGNFGSPLGAACTIILLEVSARTLWPMSMLHLIT